MMEKLRGRCLQLLLCQVSELNNILMKLNAIQQLITKCILHPGREQSDYMHRHSSLKVLSVHCAFYVARIFQPTYFNLL